MTGSMINRLLLVFRYDFLSQLQVCFYHLGPWQVCSNIWRQGAQSLIQRRSLNLSLLILTTTTIENKNDVCY